MTEKTFILEILTPDRQVFKGAVTSLEAPSPIGNFGVLRNHTPLISLLKKGKVIYKYGKEVNELQIERGFVEVLTDRVRILVEGCA